MAYRLLVVPGDNEDLRALPGQLANDIEVRILDSANDALWEVRNSPPEVIVADVELPGMSGLDLAEILPNFGVPTRVVLWSRSHNKKAAEQATSHGVYTFLNGPVSANDLHSALYQALGHAMAPPPEPPAAPKPRRNLLFTSTSRKERERAAARASEPLAPDLLSADLRPSQPAMDMPPIEPMAPPPTFEDAWPKTDRLRRGPRGATPDVPPPAPARGDAPQVTVLKSGVVDGMAYSLYSDGSIEAQMPEGMMRFASIDELRAHLDHRP
mgnify:CR=1 FL=1